VILNGKVATEHIQKFLQWNTLKTIEFAALFARKFDICIDNDNLDYIDNNILK
jgi:hypothetical protein